EELDIIPAKAQVIEYWQEKAVFDEPQMVNRDSRPLHGMASVQLLAYILVAKYADALPLYRLENILGRYGGNLSRTTMANWIIRLDGVFKPLINLIQEQQLSGDYLQTDETRLQVLKEDGKVATSDKWMWLIRGGPPDRPAVLFHYDSSRSEVVPSRPAQVRRGEQGSTEQEEGPEGQQGGCGHRQNPQAICDRGSHQRPGADTKDRQAPATGSARARRLEDMVTNQRPAHTERQPDGQGDQLHPQPVGTDDWLL
ncbi:MAG: transposase, partial [gamma proteobacterium symbiont of Clathrolucina costata]